MTTARQFYDQQPDLAVVSEKDWPTMYDLPSEYPEEPGLPDVYHDLQPQLLSATLQIPKVEPEQIFTGTDLNVYYDREHPRWHKRPDWFAVVGVPYLYAGHDMRLSYVVWDEQASPSVVVELISPGTASSDLGKIKREPDGLPTKWQVYEDYLQIPYYVVYDRYQDRLWIFKWIEGKYQEQEVGEFRYWMEDLEMGLGLWQGEFQGITRPWLRWFDAQGAWILTEVERERSQRLQADQRAETEARRAAMERQQRQAADRKAERLAARLRELGVDPDAV